MTDFFPNMIFGWLFCTVLWVMLIVLAVIDTRTTKIPNRIVVTLAVLGLIANLARSGWNGVLNHPLWIFDSGSAGLGLLDGLIFSVVGFVVAFLCMMVFWILGMCGGGDVKLFAAVGAFLGIKNVAIVWMASFIILWIWTIGAILVRGLSPSAVRATMSQAKQDGTRRRPKLRVTYSLPIAVTTIVLCLLMYGVALGLKPIQSVGP